MAGVGSRALQGRCLSWNLWCLPGGFQHIQRQSQAPLMASNALPCLFLLWCLLFSDVGTAPVVGLKARLWPWADSRGWQALLSHTQPHLLPGDTTRPHSLGRHFDAVLELWPGGAKGWLSSPFPAHRLASGLSNLRSAELFLTLMFRLTWVESFVLFCSVYLVLFFAGLMVNKLSEEGGGAAQVAGSTAVPSGASMHTDGALH